MKSSGLNHPIVEQLLDSFAAYYNVNKFEDEPYLVARCDYYEKSEKFMVSKKVNLWTANAEEFIYLFYVPELTDELYDECMAKVDSSWKEQAHIGPDHMYTYVTPIFITDNVSEQVIKKIKKCRTYKSFKFSFWGWMEYHVALVCNQQIESNSRGTVVKKMLKKVLNK